MISRALLFFLIIILTYVIALISSKNVYLHSDEINYIYDAFLVAKGELPSFMHSPSGVFTLLNVLTLFIHIFVQYVSVLEPNVDKIYYELLSDFTIIKFYYVFIVIFLLGFLLNKSTEIGIAVLFWLLVSPETRAIFLSAMPYSIAIISSFFALKFNHEIKNGRKDPNSLLDMVFFGLAVGARLEFILLTPLFFYYPGIHKSLILRRLLTFSLATLVFAPWVILYPVGPTKILLGYILAHNSVILIICVLIIMVLLFLKFYSYFFILHASMAFLTLVIFASFFDDRVSIRWALGPIIIVTAVYLQNYLSKVPWLAKQRMKSLFAISSLVVLSVHSFAHDRGSVKYDHDTVNLLEEYLIGDEMNSYINCVMSSMRRKEKLQSMGLSGVFIDRLFQGANLEEKQLNRFVELRELQKSLNIENIKPRKKLILAGGNYKGC